ncbi:MAG: response regulator, partial [Candidatus Omnitrophica bacterium]|nr:response regulator [Candidatus Omnitrophota bacterium]
PMKILFVDDEILNTDLYLEYFKTKGGLNAEALQSPEAAIAYIQQNKPDVVFLDVGLGEHASMNGLDVLRAVRRTTPESRIIMLSAYESYEQEAMREGAFAYMLKPCMPKQLLEFVSTIYM